VQKRKASLRRGSPVQPPVTYDLRLRPPTATHSPTPTYKAARPSVGAAASALLLPPLLACCCRCPATALHVCTAPHPPPTPSRFAAAAGRPPRPDQTDSTGPDPRLPRPANRPGPSEPVVRGGSPTGSLFVRMPQLRVSLYSLQRDHTKSSLPHLPPASALLSPVPAQKHLHPLPTATAAASSPFPPAFALLVVSSV
jgi:hypothetical protein